MNKVNSKQVSTLSNPNLLINGDMSVAQRGTSFPNLASGALHVDRWRTFFQGTSLRVYQANADWSAPNAFNGSRYGIAVDSGVGMISYEHIQRIESIHCTQLKAGTKITVSFDYHHTAGKTLDVDVRIWRPNNYDDWSSQYEQTSAGRKAVQHGERAAYTLTIPSDYFKGGLQVGIDLTDSATEGASVISNVKLEIGENATPFVPDDPATNLTKCQRYYVKGKFSGVATDYSTTLSSANEGAFSLPIEMREIPYVVISTSTLEAHHNALPSYVSLRGSKITVSISWYGGNARPNTARFDVLASADAEL